MWLWIRNGKGSLAGAGNHPLIARNAQWRIPLGNEDVDARGFPLQPTQCSQLPRGQWLGVLDGDDSLGGEILH